MTSILIQLLVALPALMAPGPELSATPAPAEDGQLIIEIDNVKEAKGTIWVGIYDSEDNYLVKEKAIVQGFKVERTGAARFSIPGLPYGTYAVALFHDVNDNGELDRNFFGIPTEPFAFSRPPRTKWRLPTFTEVSFQFRNNTQRLKISLREWYD